MTVSVPRVLDAGFELNEPMVGLRMALVTEQH